MLVEDVRKDSLEHGRDACPLNDIDSQRLSSRAHESQAVTVSERIPTAASVSQDLGSLAAHSISRVLFGNRSRALS